jgi:FAD/FMN-containing dehydrogenase
MNRRVLLRCAAALPFVAGAGSLPLALGRGQRGPVSRVRPGDPAWPSQESWERLNRAVGGQLIKVHSPLDACAASPSSPACAAVFKHLKNPYYLGEHVALTQTLGWVDGWTSRPSAYAVAARSTADVVAAVNFAREHRLRLVVKGGGHSYQGTSNAADSLLIWTRPMRAITLHEAFVGAGCAGRVDPQPAVSIGAGAIWGQVYNAVTTGAGRYVQGGGCMTVGVAGLIQSGGFGSFSKAYGLAAAGLLEAEVVTADGTVRIANACTNPELFWGLKGGGGGSLGVVTRLTLRTSELPTFFGGVNVRIRAASNAAYRRLIGRVLVFYREALFNPHWGEQIVFRPGNVLALAMVFQGLDRQQAEAVWRPFLDWVAASPQDFVVEEPPRIVAVPARRFWDPAYLRTLPGVVLADDRSGAPETNVFWTGNLGEAGQVLYSYQSAWLPASLLDVGRQDALADALFAATRHWSVSLHINKGLAGAPAEAVAAARDTATNPAVLDAFALAISGAGGPPAYPRVAGREPDVVTARQDAQAVERCMNALRKVVPNAGSYVSEADFFDAAWREAYWGPHYPRLRAVKDRYDPEGLFFVHHGVGSESWSADGFTPRPER